MTTPSGLLEWGQAGSYNGIDDRAVITALSAGRVGLVQAPALTAGSGLVINIGPWLAVVDCGDGTLGVIGSRVATTATETAGGASARTDVLFADITVDAGSWAAHFYVSGTEAGRLGVALGTVTVPANANTSAAMTFAGGHVTGGVSGAVGGLVAYARQVDVNHSRTPSTFTGASRLCRCDNTVVKDGRLYRFRFVSYGSAMNTAQTGTGQQLQIQFDQDSATLGPLFNARFPTNTANMRQTMFADWVTNFPGGGTHSFAVRVWTGGGSYNLDVDEAGLIMTIEDIGPFYGAI